MNSSKAELEKVNFNGSELTDANFSAASIENADLVGTIRCRGVCNGLGIPPAAAAQIGCS